MAISEIMYDVSLHVALCLMKSWLFATVIEA
jgi:hypothetical protein